MVIEYESTQEDLVQFNLFHISNSKVIQSQMFLISLISGLTVALLPLLILYSRTPKIPVFVYIVTFLIGLLFFFGYPYLYRAFTAQYTKKMFSEGNNKAYLGKQVLTLTSDGVLSKSQSTESKILWTTVERVAQNEKYIFIYIGALSAYVIPKKSFASLDTQNQFLDYINQHVTQEGKS